jgi:hypothetical protein
MQGKDYFMILAGIVKLTVVPCPGVLSSQIFPPCFSMNSLHKIKPNPVPGSFAVPLDDWVVPILKSFPAISDSIPTPLSAT